MCMYLVPFLMCVFVCLFCTCTLIQSCKNETFLFQIVAALNYLHSKNILHRDLKCENILLNEDMKPLLTDFGFAKCVRNLHDPNETYCGSSAYAPIEILKGKNKHVSKAVVQRCSVRKVFLEILQNSQESTCAKVSLLIKLQAQT